MIHCVDCEINDCCPAILLGCNGSGNDCALYIERKIGKRHTISQLREINK